jgi:hypothetical protein
VDTENLTREEWLDWRRRGIGGSDVSAIIGISPFRTARDIYYDKLGIAVVEKNEGNWVAMEMGHPLYPFMLADVDYFITMDQATRALIADTMSAFRSN